MASMDIFRWGYFRMKRFFLEMGSKISNEKELGKVIKEE